SKYSLEKDTNAFEESLESLSGIKQIIRIMTYSIMLGGIVVLSLILILWMRERVYEIGILLSIGMTKARIVGQFILELLLISIPAMLVSLLFGNILVGQILGGLLDSDSPANLSDNLLSASGGLGAMTSFLQASGILVGIIVASVLIASLMILIRKPKDILTKIG
ncbi:MAG: ABC transporter permease, partial [Peptostreptococcus sp.]|nr:ABC transporter permease [Peptostreptococcus sp.]